MKWRVKELESSMNKISNQLTEYFCGLERDVYVERKNKNACCTVAEHQEWVVEKGNLCFKHLYITSRSYVVYTYSTNNLTPLFHYCALVRNYESHNNSWRNLIFLYFFYLFFFLDEYFSSAHSSIFEQIYRILNPPHPSCDWHLHNSQI